MQITRKRKLIQSIILLCFAINCEVVNFDSKKEKERCKLTLVYRINVTKKNWNDPDYPLYLYLFSSEYKDCIQSTEELPLPKFQE